MEGPSASGVRIHWTRQMWRCIRCDESVDDGFACCWKCGANRDGVADPDFMHADLVPAHYANEPGKDEANEQGRTKPRFRVLFLLTCLACLGVLFAFSFFLGNLPPPLFVAGLAIGYLLLVFSILYFFAFLFGRPD